MTTMCELGKVIFDCIQPWLAIALGTVTPFLLLAFLVLIIKVIVESDEGGHE